MTDPFVTIEAVGMFGAGTAMLFGTDSWIAWRQQAHQRRLDARLARGSDHYMEELRSIDAYRPITKPWLLRLIGAFFVALSAAYLILSFS